MGLGLGMTTFVSALIESIEVGIAVHEECSKDGRSKQRPYMSKFTIKGIARKNLGGRSPPLHGRFESKYCRKYINK